MKKLSASIILWILILSNGCILNAKEPVKSSVDAPFQLKGNRFVTLCIMIRTTPWEVSRDVKLNPRDERDWHSLDGVRSLREAFATNNPDGRWTSSVHAEVEPLAMKSQVTTAAGE